MSTRQLLLIIGVTTVLALSLAWLIERTQVRAFVREFEPRLQDEPNPPAD